jgi:hypothetical protein
MLCNFLHYPGFPERFSGEKLVMRQIRDPGLKRAISVVIFGRIRIDQGMLELKRLI